MFKVFLAWLRSWGYRILGWGSCWSCGQFGPLSWVKETWKQQDAEGKYEAMLCGGCARKRTKEWQDRFDKATREAFGADWEKKLREFER